MTRPGALLVALAVGAALPAPAIAQRDGAASRPFTGPVAPFPASRSLAPLALPPAPPRASRARAARVPRAPGRVGTLRAVPIRGRPREGARRLLVLVEGGLPVDRQAFGRWVAGTLRDRRSWGVPITMVDAEPADLRVVLARPALTDVLCEPLETRGSYSCGIGGRAVLNSERWRGGAGPWEGDLAGYRRYLVNHEVGHLLGRGHEACRAPGARAPVMMQQTKSVGACGPNAWPAP